MRQLHVLKDFSIILISTLALGWTIYEIVSYVTNSNDPISKLKDCATILGVLIAIITYVTNSLAQWRQRTIDNARLFNEAHLSLFEKGKFLHEFYKDMDENENGLPILTINRENKDSMNMFHEFLGEIEHFSMLQEIGAISKNGNAYFFGWYAKQIKPLLDKERIEPFWQVAVKFIDEMASEGERFNRMPLSKQTKYLSAKKMFRH